MTVTTKTQMTNNSKALKQEADELVAILVTLLKTAKSRP